MEFVINDFGQVWNLDQEFVRSRCNIGSMGSGEAAQRQKGGGHTMGGAGEHNSKRKEVNHRQKTVKGRGSHRGVGKGANIA
eukprot:360633-Chlamydomonas_euryale.AAC.13